MGSAITKAGVNVFHMLYTSACGKSQDAVNALIWPLLEEAETIGSVFAYFEKEVEQRDTSNQLAPLEEAICSSPNISYALAAELQQPYKDSSYLKTYAYVNNMVRLHHNPNFTAEMFGRLYYDLAFYDEEDGLTVLCQLFQKKLTRQDFLIEAYCRLEEFSLNRLVRVPLPLSNFADDYEDRTGNVLVKMIALYFPEMPISWVQQMLTSFRNPDNKFGDS